MQVKELKQDGLSHELEVTVDSKEIERRVDIRLQEVSKTIRLPGFRPGKVPMNIMKKRYGRNVMGEVLEAAVNETSTKAMEEKGLKPALQPKIEVKEFDEGKDLIYSMAVEVLPEIKIGEFKGIKIEKPVAKPDEKSVKESLERIAESNETTAKIETDSKTKDGDTVVINFAGRTADDNVEHDGMQMDGHKLKLGSGSFIPGFEEQLIGKKAGDDVEVKVSFPEQYQAEHLAGRDAIFDTKIVEIHEAKKAEVNDELAQTLGFEDLDGLKAAVEEQSSKELDQFSKMKMKKALLDHLDDQYDLDVPEGMLDMEMQNIMRQVEMDRQQSGEAPEISLEEQEELKDIAKRRVKLGLVLSEIGTQNNITIADADLQKAVIAEAQKYPGQEKQVFEFYSKNRQALESLRAPLFEEKVTEFIFELAEIKEKEVSVEELIAEDDEEEAPKKAKKSSSKSKSSTSKLKAKKDDAGDNKAEKKEEKPKAKKAPAKKKATEKK